MVQYCSLIFKSVKTHQAKGQQDQENGFIMFDDIFKPIMENPANIIIVHPIFNKTSDVSHHFCWLVAVDILPVAFFCFQLPQLMMIQLFHYFLPLQPVPERPKIILITVSSISVYNKFYYFMIDYRKNIHYQETSAVMHAT